jgi:A/G-specific adenine glycosylase
LPQYSRIRTRSSQHSEAVVRVGEYAHTMMKGSELAKFREHLQGWFRQFQRDLPWRRTKDPYRIWISEIMLQQTRVAAVIPYYEKFLERFPDVRSLAEAPQDEVLRLWSGLGYYSRARNLQKAAQQIAAKHGGNFPRTATEVLALSGIGAYTAAAILSIAFEERHAVLDGNVARVMARLAAVRGNLREAVRWQRLQKDANALLVPNSPGDWNQAMMELGAILCTPKSPQCLLCPVSKFCEARKLGIAEDLPEKRKKRATVEVTLACAVFCDSRDRTVLLPPPGRSQKIAEANDVPTLVSRMWHFPTVAIVKNALPELRKFLTALLPSASQGDLNIEPLKKVRHAVTYRAVTVLPFRIAVKKLPMIRGAKTLTLDEFPTLPISNLTRKVARVALHAGDAEPHSRSK